LLLVWKNIESIHVSLIFSISQSVEFKLKSHFSFLLTSNWNLFCLNHDIFFNCYFLLLNKLFKFWVQVEHPVYFYFKQKKLKKRFFRCFYFNKERVILKVKRYEWLCSRSNICYFSQKPHLHMQTLLLARKKTITIFVSKDL